MIKFKIIEKDFLEQIALSVVDYYDVANDISQNAVNSSLGLLFNQLKTELTLVLEFPYVDRLYRDSYYLYHSSKLNHYNRDCIRVGLFEGKIEKENFFSTEGHQLLQERYRGFFVIRPTFPRILGQSHISKLAYRTSFKVCAANKVSNIYGAKLIVSAFPHTSQDSESYTCAETSIWVTMEYFGNKYPEYTPTLPSTIISQIGPDLDNRMLPSVGLKIEQIAKFYRKEGFGTFTYFYDDDNELLKQIAMVYIRSGIPITVGLKNAHISHAVVLIGLENPLDNNSRFVVQDDNMEPYQILDFNNLTKNYKHENWTGAVVYTISVPLYRKIYLEASGALKIIKALNSSSLHNRLFLASSKSYKNYLAQIEGLDTKAKDSIIKIRVPKFIWVCEVFNALSPDKVTELYILDCTEIRNVTLDVSLIAFSEGTWIIKSNNTTFVVLTELSYLPSYTSNLC